MAWTALAVVAHARTQFIPLPPLQPAIYRSPSHEFAVRVHPSERDGAGFADYRLTRQGEDVWAGGLPFTFRDAVVLDDGEICGAAFSEGVRDRGDIVFALVDAKGGVRWQSEYKRYTGEGLHPGTDPILRGVHTQGDGSTVTLRLGFSGPPEDERWLVHDRSTGELLLDGSPYHSRGSSWYATREARAIPGTPLALSLWSGRRDQNHLVLTDPKGSPVWELALAPSPRRLRGLEERPSPRILTVVDEQFEIGVILPTPVRVTYHVQRDEVIDSNDAGWRVREIGREPWVEEDSPVAKAATTLEVRTLELLGEIHLDFAALEAGLEPASQSLGQVRLRAVDLEGRIYIGDSAMTVVYVFDPSGNGLCIARPKPDDFDARGTSGSWIAANGAGAIALGCRFPPRMVLFDNLRTRLYSFDGPERTGQWLFVPGSQMRWVAFGFEEARLVDADGQVLRRVRKRPDGLWLDDVHSMAVSPSGALAILQMNEVHFYSERGEAIRSVPIPRHSSADPERVYWYWAAHDGEQLWLKQGAGVLRVPVSGGLPTFAELHQDATGPVFLGANAEELLVFTAERARVLRFALPRDDG